MDVHAYIVRNSGGGWMANPSQKFEDRIVFSATLFAITEPFVISLTNRLYFVRSYCWTVERSRGHRF